MFSDEKLSQVGPKKQKSIGLKNIFTQIQRKVWNMKKTASVSYLLQCS